jgi:uncharacterized repeat protein (TIGR02543 family)
MIKKFRKIAFTAAFLAIVMLSSFIISQLGVPIKVYAETTEAKETLLVDTNTFLDMRSSTNSNVDDELFVDWDYQHNENNFNHISAGQINSLTDDRYGLTLQEESNAILVNKNELGEIVGPKMTETSTLTVFTYGQSSTLSHWSNDGWRLPNDADDKSKKGAYNTFSYDYDSMIEFLRRSSNADVYVARTEAISVTQGSSWEFNVSIDDENEQSHLLLYKLEPSAESYDIVHEALSDKDYSLFSSKVSDMTKHNIILFDSHNASQYHNFVYNELNIILTQISYDYLMTIGQVPKVSMISHSTGGKWNMMWANRHPLNVDKLLAIAAPFNGTALGHLLYFDWDRIAGAMFNLGNMLLDSMGDSIHNPSGMNNVDEKLYQELHNGWEKAVSINPDIYCFAVAGPTALELLTNLAGLNEYEAVAIFVAVVIILDLIVVISALVIIEAVTLIVCTLTAPVPIASIIAAVIGLAAATAVLVVLENLLYAFGTIAQYLFDSIYVDKNGELTLYDDFIVDANSALGQEDDLAFRNGSEYSNFVRYEKTFRVDNCNPKKLNIASFAVGHNLEVQDSDVIDNVYANITMDKPETRYITTELADGTLRIDGIKDGFFNEQIIIPDSIDGKKVTQIGSGAFKDNTQIKSIEFNDGLTIIEDDAFNGCVNLEEVNFGEAQIRKIGGRAFQGTKIAKAHMPDSLIEIGDGAFYGCSLLESVLLNTSEGATTSALKYVGADAFAYTPWLDTAAGVVTLGFVLIKYKVTEGSQLDYKIDQNSSIKYFAKKCFEGSGIKSLDLTGFEFDSYILPEYFLYGATALTSVKLPTMLYQISPYALEGCVSLSSLTIPSNVQAIGSRAFANSGLVNLTMESGYPPTVSNDVFADNQFAATVWVKAYALSTYEIIWNVANIQYGTKTASLIYVSDGEIIDTNPAMKYFGYLGELPTTNKTGYTFAGWFDSEIGGTKYYEGSLWDFELDTAWVLYAHWIINNYYIGLQQYGGTSENVEYITIEDTYLLLDSVRIGYIFQGWYGNADFDGDAITVIERLDHDIRLYAKFQAITTTLLLDANGGTLAYSSISVTFGTRYFVPIPAREGYAFAGWYTTPDDTVAKGIRMVGTNGLGSAESRYLSERTLYARWTLKSFVIEFQSDTGSFILGENGLGSDVSSVVAGQNINPDDPAIVAAFKRDGYIFLYFGDENGVRLSDWYLGGVPDLGDNFSTFVVKPVYQQEQYSFRLEYVYNDVYHLISYHFDSLFSFVPEVRVGYDFVGWEDEHGKLIFGINGGSVVDFTPDKECDGGVTLYAVWSASEGQISFDFQGGIADYRGCVATYGSMLNDVVPPTKDGYRLLGFWYNNYQYIDGDGHGSKLWDVQEEWVTLAARWEVITYTLTYRYNDYESHIVTAQFSVESILALPKTEENLLYDKVGYSFRGWFRDANFTGTSLETTNARYSDFTVYAEWTINTYTLTISSETQTINTNNASINLSLYSTYTFYDITLSSNVNKLLLTGIARSKFTFSGGAATLTLYLDGVRFTSPTGYTAISAADTLNIFVVSLSIIMGADGTYNDSKTADQGAHATNHGTPSNAVQPARAGDGAVGNIGEAGTNGSIGIIASTLSIAGIGKLSVYGGDGGAGGNGGTGGNGAYGNDGQTGSGKDNGVPGGHGGQGGEGGKGGNGAVAISCERFSNSNENVYLYGGSGGTGGNGGLGGGGGKGGKGANEKIFYNAAGSGGNGGNGGSGGVGGRGGDKADVISCGDISGVNYSAVESSIGSGGFGAYGGAGGSGGIKGDVGIIICSISDGSNGTGYTSTRASSGANGS